MTLRTTTASAATALAAVLLFPGLAQADTATGSGSVGETHAFSQGRPHDIATLAPCTVGGVATASTSGAVATNFVSYGSGQSTCGMDAATGGAKVEVSGRRFRLDGLRPFGGPTIKMSSFAATCTTTENGSRSTIRMSGVTGIRLPSTIPANHVVTIRGARPDSPPIATVTLNETIVPSPPDGSMTVNLMHVRLFPECCAIASGEVVVGTVRCSPRG